MDSPSCFGTPPAWNKYQMASSPMKEPAARIATNFAAYSVWGDSSYLDAVAAAGRKST